MSLRPRDDASPPPGFDVGGAHYTDEERRVLAAVDRYKGEHHLRYLTVLQIFWVVRNDLGYRKPGGEGDR